MPDLPTVHIVHKCAPLQCMSYAVSGPEGALLIDPGIVTSVKGITENLQLLGMSMEKISHVAFTHCHIDHAGAAHLYRELGKKLIASPAAAQYLSEGSHRVWYEYPDYVIPAEVDIIPADEERLTFDGIPVQTIHTPGHTGGSASFLVETDVGLTAFTGDMVEPGSTVGWAGSEDFSVEETIRSIEKLKSHHPDRVCCGHFIVEKDVDAWLGEAVRKGSRGEWELKTNFHPEPGPSAAFKHRDS